MGVYDRQAAQALRMITAKGEKVQWNIAQSSTVPNPAQPWITVPVPPTVKNVSMLRVSKTSEWLIKLTAGSNVETGGITVIMPSYDFTPKASDTVTLSDGSVLAIQSIGSLAPNGEVILWRVEFKK